MCIILSPQLSDFFSSLFPCGAHSACNVQGSPLKCESQGVLHVAACGSSFYGSFVRLQSRPVADVGCWWMVSVDGALHGVVWYSCWQVYGTETASLLERMLYFYILLLGLLWLATSWFVSGGCACYLSIRCSYLGKSGESQARRWQRRGKTSSIKADRERMPLKMKATCHTCLQADESNLPHMLAS